MLRLDCPFCGVRSHTEFSYLGDATKTRPADDAPIESWLDFVYIRRNPKKDGTRNTGSMFWVAAHGCESRATHSRMPSRTST
ncbi:sarcosine oxidase subunit delta [Bordetella pertussis]|uniref:sarcosine oxidase subunit delta n=1 Tax=Bordetella pertussis TaxID=520 RepID=UPI0021B78406|nr:sarcosine oxidase subunit delta [Bordetella pertussis]